MTDTSPTLAETLERDLLVRYGPTIGNQDLSQALGYGSLDAFRQAHTRQQLPVPVFTIAHRRGKFALAKDVAHWLAATYSAATGPGGAGASNDA
jgi:hypothetical protein